MFIVGLAEFTFKRKHITKHIFVSNTHNTKLKKSLRSKMTNQTHLPSPSFCVSHKLFPISASDICFRWVTSVDMVAAAS